MGHNKGFDRTFTVAGGSVKTTGGSLTLAKGQLAAVDSMKTVGDTGLKVISSFAGKHLDEKDFMLKLGIGNTEPNRSNTNKPHSTIPFSLNEVKELRVSAPERTKVSVDDVIIGYNGIDSNTSFNFKTGDAYFRLTLELSGEGISYRGGRGLKEMVSVNIEVPKCDPFDTCEDCDNCDTVDCKTIIMEAVERLRRTQITGGAKVSDFIDIFPIFGCDDDVTAPLIPYDYYTLSVCDTGGAEALALVQAQYDFPVLQLDRAGSQTIYQMLLPQADGTPDDYEQTIASIIKGCDTCPSGYTEVEGGFLYSFTIEDDGTDQSALITALPNYATGTIKRAPGHAAGVGQYTAVFTAQLTDQQIATYLAGAAPRNTTKIFNHGSVQAICTNGATTLIEWTVGDTCNAIEETYSIVLPDNECGENRLTELQLVYPSLEITVAQENSVNSQRVVTLTGSSGTANITVTGTGASYLATYATSLTVTATNFVTTHAAALLANQGITVTSSGATLIFRHATTAFPTITAPANATGNLAGTIAAVTVVEQDVAGGCQTKYETTVISNLVCEECDPIYKDFYTTHQPEDYDFKSWVLVPDTTTSPSGNCKCGIRFVGKVFYLAPEMALREMVGFTEGSTKIRVSAGYPDEIREGIGILPKGAYEAEYLTHWIPRTHLAGNLLSIEKESNYYFSGRNSPLDYMGLVLTNETSNLENLMKQYIDYTVVIKSGRMSRGFARDIGETIEYHIFVGVGEHTVVENLLNDLASNAGVRTVQAFGV